MGLFHLLCPASHLGIVIEDVALVLVAKDGEVFAPIAPPIRGQYDTSGSIERIDFGPTTRQTLAGFTDLHAKRELHLPYSDPSNPFGDDLSPASLRGLLEHVRQGLIFESVRGNAESTMVRVCGRNLGFVTFLGPIYDAAVSMVRESAAGEALMDRLANMDFLALVEATLAAPVLSRALVNETSPTRDALVDLALFRSWFDARGSWSADYVSEQYSSRDLRRMVRDAKTDLARWPAMVEAVEAYERNSLRLADR